MSTLDNILYRQAKVMGAVTSLTLTADGTYMFVGTNMVFLMPLFCSAIFIGVTLTS